MYMVVMEGFMNRHMRAGWKYPCLYGNLCHMKKYTITGLVLALMFSTVAPAAAESVYGSAESSAETSAGVSAVVNSGLGTGVKGVVNALIGAGATSSGSSDASVGTSGVGDRETGALEVVVVTRADVDAGTATAVSVSPASVRSGADLSGFVAAQIAADKNVSGVESSSDNVSVTYKQRAKLFGLIPVTVNATATVLADGSVDVQYPWYAFLMATNEGELEAAIEGRVESVLSTGAGAEGDAGLELSSSAQATLISEVRSVMEQGLMADVAADAAVAAEGSGAVEIK